MRKIKFTNNQMEEIVRLYSSENKRPHCIGKKFNISGHTVIRVLREEGVKIKKVNPGTLGFKFSKESIDNVRKSKLGKPSWNKGVPLSDTHRKNVSLSLKGRVITKETRNKISVSKTGVPNKKLLGRKHTEEHRMNSKLSKIKLYEKNPEIKKKISETLKETYKNNPSIIEAQKKKHKNTLKEHPEILINMGKKHSDTLKNNPQIIERARKKHRQFYIDHPEAKEKIKEARAKQVLPKKDTSIELKIQNFLSKLHIEFYTHKYISEITSGYQCDIFIPSQEGVSQKTIIECDGCYWHGCPVCKLNKNPLIEHRIEIDKKRTKELIEKGFRVVRFWEHDIKVMELNNFKEELIVQNKLRGFRR